MGKSKSLGYQIHSALSEINLQDKEKRTDIFNKENDTNYKTVQWKYYYVQAGIGAVGFFVLCR